MKARNGLVAALCLGIASCGQPALDSSESLVGANSLPPASELAQETIEINRDSGYNPRHTLSVQLWPNNELNVRHLLRRYGGEEVVGEESIRLAPDVAHRARKVLWHVRPARLKGFEYLDYPVGCQAPIDSGMEVAVAFFGEDDSVGIFGLPYDCKDDQAAVARAVIGDVLRSLPPSKVAEGFPGQE